MRARRRASGLTEREREVLAFIRLGLTNEEIAGRLGITLDGAKYHVSQILQKLGVASRDEAAALPDERPLPWWTRALAWSAAAKAIVVATMVAVVIGLGVMAWAVLATGGTEPSDVSGLTLDGIYARALISISRSGSILHTTITSPEITLSKCAKQGEKLTPKREMWIDGGADAVRLHAIGIAEGCPEEGNDLVVGHYIYHIPGPAGGTLAGRDNFKNRCPGNDRAAIALLFACGVSPAGAESAQTPHIEEREFEGRQTVALVMAANFGSGTDLTNIHTILYLDPATLLPIADAVEGFSSCGSGNCVDRYEHEFLDRGQVTADFFNPRAIGYGLKNAGELLDALALKTPIYWLGEEHEFDSTVCTVPHSGGCPVVLEKVISDPSGGSLGQLIYNDLSIDLWAAGYLDTFANFSEWRLLNNPLCASRAEVPLADRSAVIYVLSPLTYPLVTPRPEDPCAARFAGRSILDGVIAFVDFGDVVVEVNGPHPGVYATPEAVEAVLKVLQRR